MTCIVGLVRKEKVYMGADSCGSNGHNYAIYERPKVFKIGDRFLIGCTGTFRMIDLLQYGFNPPKINEDFNRDRFMREEFIPSLRKYFKDHGLLCAENGVERFGGPFMVGFDAQLYIVQSDFSVLPVPEYGGSVGSGAEAAAAVLFFCRTAKMTPEEKLNAALEAAEGTICSVKGPFEFGEIGTLRVNIKNELPIPERDGR